MMFKIGNFSFCAATNTGRCRENNEDRYICRPVMNDRLVLLAAIDGCGGMQGGDVAAGIAEEATLTYLLRTRATTRHILCDAMMYANNFIYDERKSTGRYANMGCVMSSVLVDMDAWLASVVHVGDTRVYSIKGKSITQVTTDHSPVGSLVRRGLLTEEEARHHPMKGQLERVMGLRPLHVKNNDYLERQNIRLTDGTVLLVCSDGLTDMLSPEEILDVINSGPFYEAAQRLVDAANEAGGYDNITAVLCKLELPGKSGHGNVIPHEDKKPAEKNLVSCLLRRLLPFAPPQADIFEK